MAVFHTIIFLSLICTSLSLPQQPEINDQFQATDTVNETLETTASSGQPVQQEVPAQPGTSQVIDEIAVETANKHENDTRVDVPQISLTLKVYKYISEPIIKVVNAPKVNEVIRNIGTCIVNGAMELISYYLPAPFMPILASAAGLVIPFEPVVMLREKMPVTSYRRAFQTAMSTFLRTFDKYKVQADYDPYMTRRFNRRFMNDNEDRKEAGRTPEPAEIE